MSPPTSNSILFFFMLIFIILTSRRSRSPFSSTPPTSLRSGEPHSPSAFRLTHLSLRLRLCTRLYCTSFWPIETHLLFRPLVADLSVWESIIFSFLQLEQASANSEQVWGPRLLNGCISTSDFCMMIFINAKVKNFVLEIRFWDCQRVHKVRIDEDFSQEGTMFGVVKFRF